MYLIIDKDTGKFAIRQDYQSYAFDKKSKLDIYCGKLGPNKGKKIAEKKGNKNTIDVLVAE